MTCIVGLAAAGRVYMGCDSASTSGWELTIRSDRKVGKVGQLMIGGTTSFRMLNLLLHDFDPPKFRAGEDEPFGWMVKVFVPAVRAKFRDGGYLKIDSNREEGGSFLVGLAGQLFGVDSDFQVSQSLSGFDAVGCGNAYAKGALTCLPFEMEPEAKVRRALEVSEQWNAGVRGPFYVLATDAE